MCVQFELQDIKPSKLVVEDVSKSFTARGRTVHALDRVSLEVGEGEFVCLVGPSGCGKSTLLNLIAGLDHPEHGSIMSDGRKIDAPGRDRMVMFQEHALFPWLDVAGNVMFGLKLKPGLSQKDREDVTQYYLKLVGLEKFTDANIHELSGGMKQRVCIAIGILLRPQVIIADEPTSALDVVTQRQVMETIDRVQKEINAAVILIGHDMGLMAQFVDRVAVMYAGRLVEVATVREMFTDPKHPYSQALISSLPNLDNKGVFQGIPGLAPSLLRLPTGCAFHPRCPYGQGDLQQHVRPEPVVLPGGRTVTCHLYSKDGHNG